MRRAKLGLYNHDQMMEETKQKFPTVERKNVANRLHQAEKEAGVLPNPKM